MSFDFDYKLKTGNSIIMGNDQARDNSNGNLFQLREKSLCSP